MGPFLHTLRAWFAGGAAKAPPRRPHLRGYQAAAPRDDLVGWFGSAAGLSDAQVAAELPRIRARCRDLMFNSSVCGRAMTMLKSAIVGPNGFKISCDVPSAGDSGQPDRDASDRLEKAWKLWSETPEYCTLDGTMTLTQLLWAAVESWIRDGEAIIELVPLRLTSANPFAFALRLHRADALATPKCETRAATTISNGVEYEADTGRPVFYHFYTHVSRTGTYLGETTAVPAERILHLYTRQYADQRRGIPAFAPAAVEIRQMDALKEAEIWSARKEASRAGTWEMNDSAIDPSQVADEEDGRLYQTVEIGQDRIAPPGWKYSESAPTHPSANFPAFMKLLLQGVASGLNLNYNLLANDGAGVSYSQARTMVQEDREYFRLMQRQLIDSVLLPAFRRPLGFATRLCLCGAFGFSLRDLDRILAAPAFLPRSWQWIDVSAEAEMNEKLIALGVKTKEQLAAEMGQDYYKLVEDRAQELAWERDKIGAPDGGAEGEGKNEDP